MTRVPLQFSIIPIKIPPTRIPRSPHSLAKIDLQEKQSSINDKRDFQKKKKEKKRNKKRYSVHQPSVAPCPSSTKTKPTPSFYLEIRPVTRGRLVRGRHPSSSCDEGGKTHIP